MDDFKTNLCCSQKRYVNIQDCLGALHFRTATWPLPVFFPPFRYCYNFLVCIQHNCLLLTISKPTDAVLRNFMLIYRIAWVPYISGPQRDRYRCFFLPFVTDIIFLYVYNLLKQWWSAFTRIGRSIKEAGAGCRLKNRLHEFFFNVCICNIHGIPNIFMCKKHTSPWL